MGRENIREQFLWKEKLLLSRDGGTVLKKGIRGTWKKALGAVCAGMVLGQCVWGAQVSAAGTGAQQSAAQAAYEQQQVAQAAYEQQLAAQTALIQQEQLAAQKKAQEEHEAQLRAFQQALLSQQQAEAQARMMAAGYAVSALQPSDGRLIAAGLLSFAPETSLKGKTVSILGDSISTYQGYIPAKYACFYPDKDNDMQSVTQTWWMQMLYHTGMRLLTNGSYSASTVCGSSHAEDSSAGCSNRRLLELRGADGSVPDVILVYMGANDFFRAVELGEYAGTAVHRTDRYIWNFTEGYELMLQKLQVLYPASRIYCMTLIEANSGEHPRVNENGNTIADFNRRIREIAAAHAVPVIDVHGCGMEVYELNRYTSDGTHPNREGAAKMAAYVTNALLMEQPGL